MARHPLSALRLKGLDLVVGGAVQFLARDVLIDFRRTFAVRPVGAAEIGRVRHADGALILAVTAKTAGAGAATAGLGTGICTIETAWRPVLPVSEGLAVVAAETATISITVTTRTITERLPVTVTAGTTTEPPTVTLTITTRTITKRLPITITKRLPIPVTEGFPVTVTAGTTTEPPTVTLTITTRTITKRLPITITKRLPIPVTEGFPVTVTAGTITEPPTVTLTITTRTIT
ncbi:hypothetical protein, partial [Pseudarthrobacter sp. fls2-241-R2A-127]|uniref:hypothetical protein n=1 Tax=Pseudarthrobacter sp. fls2-241-R2A-127 TaxID=3040303 RepID=UPI0025553AF7